MMCRIRKSVVLALAAVGLVFAQGAPKWRNLYPEYNGLAFEDGKFVAVSGDGLISTSGDGTGWSHAFIREGGNARKIYAVAYGAGRFVALQRGGPYYLQSGDGYGWSLDPMNTNAFWKHIVFGEVEGAWSFVAISEEGVTVRLDDEGWGDNQDALIDLSHGAFGAGRFVVVGDGIKAMNAIGNWVSTNVSSSAKVSVVAFGNDKFAALAQGGGSAYTSDNGTSWTTVSASGVPAGMADMVFGAGKFVAVGAKGKGCVSSDGGASWNAATGLNEADDFKAVKYGGDAFLALGAKGSVYKSTDGSNWTKLAGNSVTSYKQIVYGGGKFVAVGDSGVSVSSDGKSWDRKESAKNLVGVAFGDGKFVAVGSDGAIISSATGDAWEDHGVDDAVLTSVVFGGGVFVAGGRTTGTPQTSQAVVYTSTNGQNWTDVSNDLTGWSTGQYPVALCSDGDKFLAAVSGNKTMKSCDATAIGVKYGWVNVSLPEQADGYNMVSATYADNKFIVLGTKPTGEAVVLNSAAAENWTALMIPQEMKGVRSVTCEKDTYIAVADSGNVYAYLSGSWVSQSRATNRNLSAIYSRDNVILAAGAGGAMLYSEDPPTSVRYASAPRKAASYKGGVMSLERTRGAPVVKLSFTPNGAGTVAVYSLGGRRLYKTRLGVGERSALLPERAVPSGSVIIRYSGDGRVVSQRFQVVR